MARRDAHKDKFNNVEQRDKGTSHIDTMLPYSSSFFESVERLIQSRKNPFKYHKWRRDGGDRVGTTYREV